MPSRSLAFGLLLALSSPLLAPAALADEPDRARLPGEADRARLASEPDRARQASEPDRARLVSEPDRARLAIEPDRARLAGEPDRARLAGDGHKKKVLGASLMIVGSLLDAATTALTFTGLGRGGWTFAPKDATDKALLWSGVAGNFVLDITLTMGIVVYCQGGDEMRRSQLQSPR